MNCGYALEATKQKSSQPQNFDQAQPQYDRPAQQRSAPYAQNAPNTGYQDQYQSRQGEPSAIAYICSCIPIVGLILYFVYREDYPDAAKNMLIIAAVVFFLSIIGSAA